MAAAAITAPQAPMESAFVESKYPGIRSGVAEMLMAHPSHAMFAIDDAHLKFERKRDFWTERVYFTTPAGPQDGLIIHLANESQFAGFVHERYQTYCWIFLSGRQQRLRRSAARRIATSPVSFLRCECGREVLCETDEVRCWTCWQFFVVQTKKELYLEEVNGRYRPSRPSKKKPAARAAKTKAGPPDARSSRTLSSGTAANCFILTGKKRRADPAEDDDNDAPPAKKGRRPAEQAAPIDGTATPHLPGAELGLLSTTSATFQIGPRRQLPQSEGQTQPCQK